MNRRYTATLSLPTGKTLLTWIGASPSRDDALARCLQALRLAWLAAADARGPAPGPMPAQAIPTIRMRPLGKKAATEGGTSWTLHGGLIALLGPEPAQDPSQPSADRALRSRASGPACEAAWPWEEAPGAASWAVVYDRPTKAPGFTVSLNGRGWIPTRPGRLAHDLDPDCAAAALAHAARHFLERGRPSTALLFAEGKVAPPASATLAALWRANRPAELAAASLPLRGWLAGIGAQAEADAVLRRIEALGIRP